VRCAHPSFGNHCHAKRALRAPPAHRSFTASYSTLKNKLNLSNSGRPREGLSRKINAFLQAQTWASHVKGFFLSTGPHRLLNRRPPAPPIAASLILPVMFWGQYYVRVRPYALFYFCYSFLIFPSFLFLFIHIFLSFSSFSSFFVFLFFFSYI
jgi:hypothetical protein